MNTRDYPDPPITLATLRDWARELRAAVEALPPEYRHRVDAVRYSVEYRIEHIRAEETRG